MFEILLQQGTKLLTRALLQEVKGTIRDTQAYSRTTKASGFGTLCLNIKILSSCCLEKLKSRTTTTLSVTTQPLPYKFTLPVAWSEEIQVFLNNLQ